MSLTARPDDFTVTVFGAKATIRLDLQDMLFCQTRLGRMPKPIARGMKVASTNLNCLAQLALNPIKLALGRALGPADPLPLLRAFHHSLQSGAAPPVSFEEAVKVVEIIRTIWPLAHKQRSRQPVHLDGHVHRKPAAPATAGRIAGIPVESEAMG